MVTDVSLPVAVEIINDQDAEESELFLIEITLPNNPPVGLEIGSVPRAEVTIEDDDSERLYHSLNSILPSISVMCSYSDIPY